LISFLPIGNQVRLGKWIKDLVNYIDGMKILLEKLEVHQIEDKGVITEFYSSNHVKKLFKFN
jgi:hypothetical protein